MDYCVKIENLVSIVFIVHPEVDFHLKLDNIHEYKINIYAFFF
jgi:hypothetical protein